MYAQPSPALARSLHQWRQVNRIVAYDDNLGIEPGTLMTAASVASSGLKLFGGLFGGPSKRDKQKEKADKAMQLATPMLDRMAQDPYLVVKFIEDPNSVWPNCTRESVKGRSCKYIFFTLAADAGCPTHVDPQRGAYRIVYNHPSGWYDMPKDRRANNYTGQYATCLREKLPEIKAILGMMQQEAAQSIPVQPLPPQQIPAIPPQPIPPLLPSVPKQPVPAPAPAPVSSCPFGYAIDPPSGFCLPVDTGQYPITYTDPATGDTFAPGHIPGAESNGAIDVTKAGVLPLGGGPGMLLLIGGSLALAVLAGGEKRKRKPSRKRR